MSACVCVCLLSKSVVDGTPFGTADWVALLQLFYCQIVIHQQIILKAAVKNHV